MSTRPRARRQDPSSLGKNYWTIQPLAALTYTQPTGLNADLKVMYDFNQRNSDTRTRSGQAIHADYSLGWGLGGAWAGLGGGRGRLLPAGHGRQGSEQRDGQGTRPGRRSVDPLRQPGRLAVHAEVAEGLRGAQPAEGNQLLAKLVIPF